MKYTPISMAVPPSFRESVVVAYNMSKMYISVYSWGNAQEMVVLIFMLPSDWTKAKGESNVPVTPV